MPKRITLLLVEDDEELRRMYRTALSMGGFDVREAADGWSALQRIEEALPDAIILDLDLPRLPGSGVLDDLKASARARHIPVVVVTGTDADAARLQEQGAICVLRKPLPPEALAEAVWDCLRTAESNSNGGK